MTDQPNDVRSDYAVLNTGIRLRFYASGDPNGKAVIFLHDYADSWFSWSAILAQISATIHAIAPDLRGHGESDKPESGYSISDFADDVIALMDSIKLEKAALVGHSMGSLVAQEVAIKHPDRVEKLVLIGSATTLQNEGIIGLNDAVQRLDDISPAFIEEFQRRTVAGEVPEAFMKRIISESQNVPLHVWKQALSQMLTIENIERLSAINVPTLVLYGANDNIFPQSEQELMQSKLSQVTFKAYPAVGHAPHWEVPAEVISDLDAFLSH